MKQADATAGDIDNMMTLKPRIILASASPRRVELLNQIGIEPRQQPAHIDETPYANEPPEHYVLRMAREKAAAITSTLAVDSPAWVIGADTAVVVDDEILGKPADQQDAARMLGLLSGRTHCVLSAVAVSGAGEVNACCVETQVRFRVLTAQEIDAYWRSGEPVDKAGGYGIQGLGAVFIEWIQGSYTAVMGLPLFETASLLAQQNIHVIS